MNRWIKCGLFLGAAGLLACILSPAVSTVSHHSSSIATATSDGRLLAIKITEWMTRGGKVKLLRNLDDLPADFIPYRYRRYMDRESGRAYDWLYYGEALKHDSPFDQFILLAAPRSHEARLGSGSAEKQTVRVVVYLNASAVLLSEEVFRERIRLQEAGIFEEEADEE